MIDNPIDVSTVKAPLAVADVLRRDPSTPTFNEVLGKVGKAKLAKLKKGWPETIANPDEATPDDEPLPDPPHVPQPDPPSPTPRSE